MTQQCAALSAMIALSLFGALGCTKRLTIDDHPIALRDDAGARDADASTVSQHSEGAAEPPPRGPGGIGASPTVITGPRLCGGVECEEGDLCCILDGSCFNPKTQPSQCPAPSMPGPEGSVACGSDADCASGEFCAAKQCLGNGTCMDRNNCGSVPAASFCGCDGRVYPDMQSACFAGTGVSASKACGASRTKRAEAGRAHTASSSPAAAAQRIAVMASSAAPSRVIAMTRRSPSCAAHRPRAPHSLATTIRTANLPCSVRGKAVTVPAAVLGSVATARLRALNPCAAATGSLIRTQTVPPPRARGSSWSVRAATPRREQARLSLACMIRP